MRDVCYCVRACAVWSCDSPFPILLFSPFILPELQLLGDGDGDGVVYYEKVSCIYDMYVHYEEGGSGAASYLRPCNPVWGVTRRAA